MSETTEQTVGTTPRCGHETKSGPCCRPEGHGHPATGHMSKAIRDAKTATARGKSMDPEAMATREAERAAKAALAIKAAEEAHAAKIARLEEAAAALGFKLVAMSKRERAAAQPAAE
jgi:hypothetical protein